MTTVDKTNTHYKLQGNPITTSQDTPDNQSSRRTAKEKKGKQMSLISRSRPIPCNNPTIRGNVSFSKYVIINFSSALVKRAHRHWTGEIYDSIYAEKRSLFCIGKNTSPGGELILWEAPVHGEVFCFPNVGRPFKLVGTGICVSEGISFFWK